MNILIYTHSWFPFISGVTFRYKQIIDVLKKNNNIISINPYSDEKCTLHSDFQIFSFKYIDLGLRIY